MSTGSALPPPPLPPPERPATAAAAGITVRQWQLVGVIAGGVLIVVGSIAPWAEVSTVFGTATVSGTSGDGKLTAIAGGVVALGFLVAKRWAIVVAAIVAFGVAVIDIGDVSRRIAEVNDTDIARGSTGWGLWVVVIASAVALGVATRVRHGRRLL